MVEFELIRGSSAQGQYDHGCNGRIWKTACETMHKHRPCEPMHELKHQPSYLVNQCTRPDLSSYRGKDWKNLGVTIQWIVIDCSVRVCSVRSMSNTELLAEMREWIADSLSCYKDYDLSDAEVLKAVGFHYEGGTDQFRKDGLVSLLAPQCQHETEGNRLARLYQEQAQRRNVAHFLDDSEPYHEAATAQLEIKSEMARNLSLHEANCGKEELK